MADLAAKKKAVVIAGTDFRSFVAEVLSAHVDDSQFAWSTNKGQGAALEVPSTGRTSSLSAVG
jgi:hypothetical protein